MNRREFTRNMLAAASLPALPMPALAKAQAVAVPKAARFWAIYMTHLHGDVTPGLLTQMTGIAPAQTKAIRAKLIADKVITPTGFVRKSVAAQSILRSEQKAQSTLSKIKKPMEKAAELTERNIKTLEDDPQEPEETVPDSLEEDEAAREPEET